MLDHLFCERILQIESPWRVTKVKQDLKLQCVDIWVGEKSNWLKPAFIVKGGFDEEVWQHLGFGGFRIYIHAVIRGCATVQTLSWMGAEGQPFTYALTQRILELLGERTAYGVICSLLNVDLEDVWRLKHSLEGNSGGGDMPRQVTAPISGIHGMGSIAAPDPGNGIPTDEDPVWHLVISNENNLSIRQLGLKLLISRVRTQYINAGSDEIRSMRRRELRKYFVRHQRSLQYELSQIKPFSQTQHESEQA